MNVLEVGCRDVKGLACQWLLEAAGGFAEEGDAFDPQAQRLPVDARHHTQREGRVGQQRVAQTAASAGCRGAAEMGFDQGPSASSCSTRATMHSVPRALRRKRNRYRPAVVQNGETWNTLSARSSWP